MRVRLRTSRDDPPAPPLLAAEVASPSTSLFDRHTKRAAYERLGVASYWPFPVTVSPAALLVDTRRR